MKRILNYTIKSEDAGSTVRDYLLSRGYSNAVLIQLKKIPYSILVNGEWYYVNDKLCEGDTMTITIDEQESSKNIVPIPLPLDIVYEDLDIIILNKPADQPIHPSMNNYDCTLANGIMHYYLSQDIPYTFRCINRLDRDTTGLTIVAKHALSGGILSNQMVQRKIHRTYLAIVQGITPEKGTISAPIARKPDSTIERMVDYENGESAITHFYRIATTENLSLIALQLETGRTHQIRVHMTHMGHPLVGDFLYNPTDTTMNRQALHSYSLDFTHPITLEVCHFTAELPSDMTRLFSGDYAGEMERACGYFCGLR